MLDYIAKCPRCGGDAEVWPIAYSAGRYVECQDCGRTDSEDEWNKNAEQHGLENRSLRLVRDSAENGGNEHVLEVLRQRDALFKFMCWCSGDGGDMFRGETLAHCIEMAKSIVKAEADLAHDAVREYDEEIAELRRRLSEALDTAGGVE